MADLTHIRPATHSAEDVARGVARQLLARGFSPLVEFPLGNGRRVDVAAVDRRGRFVAVEIKVSVADYRADAKWPEYLDYCDMFYFAVPPEFPAELFDATEAMPERTGLMIADRFDAMIVRHAAEVPMNGSRRKAETLRFARKAASRLHGAGDPDFSLPWKF